jgi:hypothetical protein
VQLERQRRRDMPTRGVLEVEVEILESPVGEYRVIERSGDRSFRVVRASLGEPVELLAQCPYTYNRESAKARAIRVAEVLRDEEAPLGPM